VANHGGRRPGAGRPADAGERRTELCRVPLTPGELAELLDAAGPRPLAEYLRDAALARARARR
jgi:hypothetical protein